MNWYVLYTKSRSGKVVAEKLAKLGIQVYCPLIKSKKLWSDRWKWVEEPTFRSYCFVHIDEKSREAVFTVPGVVRYLYYCSKPAIIRAQNMNLLKLWLEQYDHDNIKTYTITVNDRIVFRTGALIEQQAEVVRIKGNNALIYLESLGIQVKVDLRKNDLQKIGAC